MVPLKDNLPTRRAPVISLTLVVLTLLAIWLWDAPTVPFLLAAWAQWIAGRSVEDSVSRPTFVAFCALAAAAAGGLQAITDDPAGTPAQVVCLAGLAAGLTGAYLRLYPQGKVLTMIFAPVFASMIEAPARVVVAGWLLLQTGLTLTGLGEGLAVWAPAAAALLGAALLPAIRPSRNPLYDGRADSVPGA